MAKKVLDALTAKFGGAIEQTHSELGDETVVVAKAKLRDVVTHLKTDPKLLFDCPVFVTCIDRLGGPEEDDDKRFEVCWQLRSMKHHHRIRIKVRVSESSPKVPSLSDLYPAFNWQERETHDMYGIVFESHPDLRRIYMYEQFEGHPLRKDYPKEGRQPLVRRDWSDEVTDK